MTDRLDDGRTPEPIRWRWLEGAAELAAGLRAEAGDGSSVFSREPFSPLDDVRALIQEALQMALHSSKAKADWPDGTLPPTRAVRALQDSLAFIATQDLRQDDPPGLGLSRGAGDLLWDPEDEPIVDKVYAIENAWFAACADARAGRRP